MYYIRFTKDKEIKNSFNHFTGEELNGVCAYQLGDVEENGLAYEIRQNVNPTYQKFYDGQFIIFTGTYVEDNFNGEGVVVKADDIVGKGVVVDGNYGWVVQDLKINNTFDYLV